MTAVDPRCLETSVLPLPREMHTVDIHKIEVLMPGFEHGASCGVCGQPVFSFWLDKEDDRPARWSRWTVKGSR